jgi:predicted protein tyrosine phosphatase
MKITISNRKKVYSATLRAEKPFAVIQFSDPEYKFAPFANEGCAALLRFRVHDVDSPESNSILFSDEDANQIIKRVVEGQSKFQEIICQCDAGISRSSGCAAALSLILNGSDEDIFSQKRYIPNRHIYRSILNAWEAVLPGEQNEEQH